MELNPAVPLHALDLEILSRLGLAAIEKRWLDPDGEGHGEA